MTEPTNEELKSEGALSTPSQEYSVSMFKDVERRRIWRTLDLQLLPFVSLLYLMSFLYVLNPRALRPPLTCILEIRRDRSNIGRYSASIVNSETHYQYPTSQTGNAKIAGMSTNLHLVGLRYNTAAAIFFVKF